MRLRTIEKANREKGIALIIAIGFLGILSILGAVIMNISTQGLSESGGTLPKQQAFYAADQSVEYAMNRDLIVNLPVGGTVVLADPAATGGHGDEALDSAGGGLGQTHDEILNGVGSGQLVAGTVSDIGPRALPPAMAEIHGTEFGANLYHVNVETKAPFGGTTNVDAAIVRLFKIDDETIFRTSSGG